MWEGLLGWVSAVESAQAAMESEQEPVGQVVESVAEGEDWAPVRVQASVAEQGSGDDASIVAIARIVTSPSDSPNQYNCKQDEKH